ncbi:unnamed protein product [Leuciscus chuanchicus]
MQASFPVLTHLLRSPRVQTHNRPNSPELHRASPPLTSYRDFSDQQSKDSPKQTDLWDVGEAEHKTQNHSAISQKDEMIQKYGAFSYRTKPCGLAEESQCQSSEPLEYSTGLNVSPAQRYDRSPSQGAALCPLQHHCINVDLQTSIKLCKAHSRLEDIVYANVDA